MSFVKGQKILCLYDDDYYPGTIKKCNPNGTYYVLFDDGDVLKDAVIGEIISPIDYERKRDTDDFLNIKEFDPSLNKQSEIEMERNSTARGNLFEDSPTTESNPQEKNDLMVAGLNVRLTVPQFPDNLVPQEPPSMAQVLSEVEAFLLPLQDERYLVKRNLVADTSVAPYNRLTYMLNQVLSAEYIRTMQTLYRDSEDDMRLVSEVRLDNPHAKLTSKLLVERIIEGRSRIVALCDLCYGNNSVELLRAHVDLANSYALRGLWPQVLNIYPVRSLHQRSTRPVLVLL